MAGYHSGVVGSAVMLHRADWSKDLNFLFFRAGLSSPDFLDPEDGVVTICTNEHGVTIPVELNFQQLFCCHGAWGSVVVKTLRY